MLDIDDSETLAVLGSVPTLERDGVRSGGYVLHTLAAAFWCLLNHDSLEETIVAAVALGEDTDTTAAVAGALAGARYGKGPIPDRWLGLLQPRARLEELATQLLARAEAA